MSLKDVLDKKRYSANDLKLLAEYYTEKTQKKIKLTCRSQVNFMILSLKDNFDMMEFEFKHPSRSYKDKVGGTFIVSQTSPSKDILKFLKTKPERINLFSKYPENWRKLVEHLGETQEQKDKRLAIAAEQKAIEEAKVEEAPQPPKKKEDDHENQPPQPPKNQPLENEAAPEKTAEQLAEEAANEALNQ